MTRHYTGSRRLSVRLDPYRLVRRLLRPLHQSTTGATTVEYLMIVGFVAIGMIYAYRRYRAHTTVVVRNEAKIIRTMDAPDPEDAILALGGYDQVREPPRCVGDTCWIPGVECFGAGTLVATETGDRPIETIQVGERVWARASTAPAAELRPVTRVFVTPARPVVEVTLMTPAGSETLTVTPNHPFWADGTGWIPAKDLGATPLWSFDSNVTASAVSTTSMPTTVYNLEVEGLHTYFVGAFHAWVHNQCEDFDPDRDCFDRVMALPHTTYRNRQAELRRLCDSGEYRFNDDTGRLRNVNSGNYPPPVSEPCLKDGIQTHTPSNQFDQERQRLLDERAQALCSGNQPVANNISERLGDNAARNYADQNFPASAGWRPVSTDNLGSGAHSYDVVYTRTNPSTGEFEVALIEAKGGIRGELGTRWEDLGPDVPVGSDRNRVQQGTEEYARTIANAMRRDPARRATGQQILDALDDGNVQYQKVHQTVGPIDCDADPPTGSPGPIQVSDFAMYDSDRQGNPNCG